jgi:hypothetical protein
MTFQNFQIGYNDDPVAQRLRMLLEHWTRAQPGWAYETQNWALVLRDATAVANDLLEQTEIAEIGLARLLASPDGQMIRTVVSWVLPFPQGAEFDLLVDAITRAAEATRNGKKETAGFFTLLAVGVGALLLVSHFSD